MSLKKNLQDTLVEGLEQLIRDGSNKRFWSSTRSTADALIALNICTTSNDYVHLKEGGLKFLRNSAEESSGNTMNWMEEIWDTSITLIALIKEPVKYSVEINKASNWIASKYINSHNSWNEEVWETLLALNAISYLERSTPKGNRIQVDYSGATQWLMKMIDTPKNGILINWSSTALFILFANSPQFPGMTSQIEAQLQISSQKCALTILNASILDDDNLLWTAEAWSNGLVLWALSVSHPTSITREKIFKITKWFKERISSSDLPTEDRAFSCIGLFKFLEWIEINDVKLKNDKLIEDKEKASILIEDVREKLQNRIASGLRNRITDFHSNPPLITLNSFEGYYSFHFRKKVINIFLIFSVTTFLSYLTWQSQTIADKMLKWLILIPIALGTLATVAQLANFSIIPKPKNDKKSNNY